MEDKHSQESLTPAQALAILEACKPLLAKFNAGGVYQELTPQEEALLESFHQLEEAGWVGENAWDDTLRMRADLLRSDIGLLSYAYGLMLQRRDPQGTLAEIKVVLDNYLEGKKRAKKAHNN